MPTDACRGNSTFPLHKGTEVQKIWNSPLIRRKEADTNVNVLKNTIFHYKIDGNQSLLRTWIVVVSVLWIVIRYEEILEVFISVIHCEKSCYV